MIQVSYTISLEMVAPPIHFISNRSQHAVSHLYSFLGRHSCKLPSFLAMARLSMSAFDYELNPTEPGFTGRYERLRWTNESKVSMSIMDTNGEVFMDVVMLALARQQASIDPATVPTQGTFRVIYKDFGIPGVRLRAILVEIVDTAMNSTDPRDSIKFEWQLDVSITNAGE